MSNRNRDAGNNYERLIIRELKEVLGRDDIVSTRAESRNLDNRGIDIIIPNMPQIKIQCKTMATQPNFLKLLTETDANIVVAKKTKKANTKFIEQGQYVVMSKEMFYGLIKK